MRKLLLAFTVFGFSCGAAGAGAPEPTGTADPVAMTDDAAAPADGFPCDVRAVLETYCAGCHAGTYYAPYWVNAQTFREGTGDGGTFGDQVAARLQDSMRPMPPASVEARPTDDERNVILAWIAAGMPGGTCGPLTRP